MCRVPGTGKQAVGPAASVVPPVLPATPRLQPLPPARRAHRRAHTYLRLQASYMVLDQGISPVTFSGARPVAGLDSASAGHRPACPVPASLLQRARSDLFMLHCVPTSPAFSAACPPLPAVGNTMKRVAVVVSSVLFFKNPVSSERTDTAACGLRPALDSRPVQPASPGTTLLAHEARPHLPTPPSACLPKTLTRRCPPACSPQLGGQHGGAVGHRPLLAGQAEGVGRGQGAGQGEEQEREPHALARPAAPRLGRGAARGSQSRSSSSPKAVCVNAGHGLLRWPGPVLSSCAAADGACCTSHTRACNNEQLSHKSMHCDHDEMSVQIDHIKIIQIKSQ